MMRVFPATFTGLAFVLALILRPGAGFCEKAGPREKSGPASYEQAVELLEKGRDTEAAAVMIRALEARPRPAAAAGHSPAAEKHFKQGMDYVRTRYDSLAEKEFRDALAADPRYAAARYQLAFLKGNKGAYREMFNELWQASQRREGEVEKLRALAGLALVARDIPKAIAYYRRALVKDPSSPEITRMLGLMLVESGKSREGFQLLGKAVKQAPSDYSTLSTMGLAYALGGEYGRSAEYLKKAIAINPQCPEATGRLGIVLLLQGRTDESIQCLTEAADGNPDQAELCANLAKAYKATGRLDEAAEQYRRAIKIDPADYETWYEMGNILSSQGKIDKALEAYEKAGAIEPGLAKTYYKAGLLYARKKMYDRAEERFKKTIKTNCDYADAYYALGILEREYRKDFRSAAHYFKMYLVYDSSSGRAAEAIRWLERRGAGEDR